MHFEVLVIGSGQAGVPLATQLASDGKSVLLVERKNLGGTCVNYGCTPTKTMVASARVAHVARRARRLGVETGPVRVDLGAVVDRKNEIVRQWREGVQGRLDGAGPALQWRYGHARFVGPRKVQVGDDVFTADTVVVNTGGRPVVPDLPGLDQVAWLDNASIMQLRELPQHLVILGGGYIACEFGQMFRRFGAEVTIVQRGSHLFGREDPDVASAVEEALRAEGLTVLLDREGKRVRPDGETILLELDNGGRLRASHLLVATGRRPNTDDLGCQAGGINLDKRGAIVVDENYRTSAAGVYAVGDVIGGPQFTHTSWDDHRLLYQVLRGRKPRNRHDRLVPYCVFTDPPLARVGLSESEARQAGIEYELATMDFGNIARAIEIDETAGLLKVLVDPKTERVLGAAIVGAEAGELIHMFVVLMQAGAPARAIVDVQVIHPTLAEGVQSVLLSLDRYA